MYTEWHFRLYVLSYPLFSVINQPLVLKIIIMYMKRLKKVALLACLTGFVLQLVLVNPLVSKRKGTSKNNDGISTELPS